MTKGKSEAGGVKMTQKDMVSAAIEELGEGAKPQPMQAFIKETFNVDLAANIISNYKSVLKRKGATTGTSAGAGAKRGRKAGAQFADLEAVRGLVSRLGAAQVKELVEVADRFA